MIRIDAEFIDGRNVLDLHNIRGYDWIIYYCSIIDMPHVYNLQGEYKYVKILEEDCFAIGEKIKEEEITINNWREPPQTTTVSYQNGTTWEDIEISNEPTRTEENYNRIRLEYADLERMRQMYGFENNRNMRGQEVQQVFDYGYCVSSDDEGTSETDGCFDGQE